MPFTLQVHEYARVPGTTESRLVSERPYVRLRGPAGEPAIFLQGGQWRCLSGLRKR
jgi:hypothetical protein